MAIDNKKDLILFLYKGDKISGIVYVIISVMFFIISGPLYFLGSTLGYIYLSLGFVILGCYSLAKGLSIYWVSSKRKSHYEDKAILSSDDFKEETAYTQFRLRKKIKNRRRYIYTLIFGCIVAFCGIFTLEKGLVMGTSIPIVLYAGIEFCIGLLVEFRLNEYLRQLQK
jgi:hypothetical protein